MQIVIEIDENLYKDIYANAEIMIYSGMRSGKMFLATLLRAIRKGVPLPEGHGRLIDADAYAKKYETNINGRIGEEYIIAPTVIEADKEE